MTIYYYILIPTLLFILNIIFYHLIISKYQQKKQFPLLKQNSPNKDVNNKGLNKQLSSPPQNVQVLHFTITGGQTENWYFSDNTIKPAIIIVHGNEGLIDTNVKLAQDLQRVGLHVLLCEYPGYGRSTGDINEKTVQQALDQAYNHLKQKAEVNKILIYGSSMGGSLIGQLLKSHHPDGIILRASFSNFGKLISRMTFVPSYFIHNAFNNEKLIKAYKGRLLLLHAKGDKIVSFKNAETLAKLSSNVSLLSYVGDHDQPDDTEVVKQISIFLAQT